MAASALVDSNSFARIMLLWEIRHGTEQLEVRHLVAQLNCLAQALPWGGLLWLHIRCRWIAIHAAGETRALGEIDDSY
jgi:hypothetical protein